MTTRRRVRAERGRQMTIIYAVMTCMVIVVFLQLLLLMVAVEGYLGGRSGMILPAAAGSGVCFAGACWLIRPVLRVPRESSR
jgi:hypothetical protein